MNQTTLNPNIKVKDYSFTNNSKDQIYYKTVFAVFLEAIK